MTTRKLAASAIAAALVLTLTACGGDDGGDGSGSGDEQEIGALEQFWADAYGGQSQEDANAEMTEVEEEIAACMADLGFEYTPVNRSSTGGGVMAPSADDGDGPKYGTLEFAEQYGYGATTNPWDSEDAPAGAAADGERVDPNQDYIDSMSDTQQTAYHAALYGDQPELTEEELETYEASWEDLGCTGRAQQEVYGDTLNDGGGDNDELTALDEEYFTMLEAVDSDPRVAETVAEWTFCMADADFPGLTTIDDAQNSFLDKVNAIYDASYADLPEDATEDDNAAVEAEVQDELSALTGEEIETAVADYTCRDESGYTEAYQKASIEFQQEFYDAHKTELEAYAEALGLGAAD